MKPLIAVIIPCYDRWTKFEDYLTIAMQHAEPLADFRIYKQIGEVVVKDGTQKSWSKMAEVVGKLRNEGIKEALLDGANYIFLTDDDNLLPPDFFNVMLMFDNEPVKTCAGINQTRKKEDYQDFGFRAERQQLEKGLCWFQYVRYGNSILFLKASVFGSLKYPYYTGINEDYGFYNALAEAGFKVFVAPLIAVEYR